MKEACSEAGVGHGFHLIVAIVLVVALVTTSAFADNPHCVYRSPLSGATLLSPSTNLIMSFDLAVDSNSLGTAQLHITGSATGTVNGTIRLSDDGHTVLFKPTREFVFGETVHVALAGGLVSTGGDNLGPLIWQFVVSASRAARENPTGATGDDPGNPSMMELQDNSLSTPDTLPSDFPDLRVTVDSTALPGDLYLASASFALTNPNTPYLLVLKDSGNPLFYRKLPSNAFDFKRQETGGYTYYLEGEHVFVGLDSNFQRIASYKAGNGYATDLHELRLLPNGHALLLALDSELVDMSKVVIGGDPHALVVGNILQELDRSGDVVFQWRSWDYFSMTDASLTTLTAPLVDPIHMNAIDVDGDGNILLSSRHLDEITKINRTNGEIVWRLGGRRNQFRLMGDTVWFSHQHAIRRLPNGHYTLFDNGNGHAPPYSRAIEVVLDTVEKTCLYFWKYTRGIFGPQRTYSQAMGNVQRLPDGNTLIGWGATGPALSIVGPEGNLLYELWLPDQVYSYRAFVFPSRTPATDVRVTNSHDPPGFALAQNYPNPFNPTTRIRYTLGRVVVPSGALPSGAEGPVASKVSLVVYDVLGREVATLVNEVQAPGTYEVRFSAKGGSPPDKWRAGASGGDGNRLSSGVYYYRLRAGSFAQSRKMVLLK